MSNTNGNNGNNGGNGNPPGGPSRRGGRNRRKKQPTDFWRAPQDVELDVAVRPADDPTAALRSLGAPPLPGQGAGAEHYLSIVVHRAAGLATALAAAAEILDTTDE
jgi:hypothetical protein